MTPSAPVPWLLCAVVLVAAGSCGIPAPAAEPPPPVTGPLLLPPREPSPANPEDGGPMPQDPRDRSSLPIPEPPVERRESMPVPPVPEAVPRMPDPAFPVPQEKPSIAPASQDFPKPGRLPARDDGPLEPAR